LDIEWQPRLARGFSIPLVATLGFLLIVVLMLVVGGNFVRSVVGQAFQDAERIRSTRMHVANMVNQQLDEETGVRGYAVMRSPIMLDPYFGGRAALPAEFARVRKDLNELGMQSALPALDDAVATNNRWLHRVAFPMILAHHPHRSVELRGKVLVDRFRRDAAAIDATMAQRAALVNARAEASVVWVGGFASCAVLAVILAAVIFTVQQYRLTERLERERLTLDRARRRSAEHAAAYEAEKRIADILQEAFSERLLPELDSVQFSATYVPATEQTKIGGDWYDALQLPDDRVLVVIGDVTGHGIDAVVAMNKARQLVIGCALLDATPARILARVNLELVRARSPIITACCGVVDTRTRELEYAAAGHPPPVLLEPGCRARLLDFGALPLGVTTKVEYRTRRVQTVPGATIVFYTDGALEYGRDLASGEAALLAAVELVGARAPADAARAIRDTIFRRRKVTDDVAILTLRLSEKTLPAASPRRIA
jgi:serine phosphatase RsbU (regulator of sigma subunit)/CHASE3 domain sensor protein